ncbi:unnamed protein product [Gongylonema pulchrum]|uniref:Secreted protein n=1 Tax=Gongylonema pulchrum TaxID=637853 RepID=A0A183DLH1_9BILA|nr:unnamed protein product [Gongylonema pulchrum]
MRILIFFWAVATCTACASTIGPPGIVPRLLTPDVPKAQPTIPGYGIGDDVDEDTEDSEAGGVQWECGTESLTKLISEATVDRDCPQLKSLLILS